MGSGAVIPVAGAKRRQKGAAIEDPGPLVVVPRRVSSQVVLVLLLRPEPGPGPGPEEVRTANSRAQERAEDLGPTMVLMMVLLETPLVGPWALRGPTLAKRATAEELPLVVVGP